MGRVVGLGKRGVKVTLRAPIKRGDGVVFEHGQAENREVRACVGTAVLAAVYHTP